MSIALLTLAAVLGLTAVRKVGALHLEIWQIMTLGAATVLVTGEISVDAALRAIDLDVLALLFGMFVVGQALHDSGYLFYLSHRLFRHARTTRALVLWVVLAMGGASAFLMNDTLAVVGTPLVLLLAREHRLSPKLLLLALALAVTTGSTTSPIGNPQNLLIALHGAMDDPFVTFARALALPTLLNLVLVYGVLRWRYADQFHTLPLVHDLPPLKDHGLARLARVALIVLVLGVALKIALATLGAGFELRLTYIALAAALPIVLLSPARLAVLRRIDWHTLVFFAALFVLMACVWQTGVIQSLLAQGRLDLSSIPMIMGLSILLSQLISNVPLVALYLPALHHAGVSANELLALAAGSTIAGNLFVLGAASNVIIIQNAERRAGQTLTFVEFATVGIPLTLVQSLIYGAFLAVA